MMGMLAYLPLNQPLPDAVADAVESVQHRFLGGGFDFWEA